MNMNNANLLPSSVLQRPDECTLALGHVFINSDEDLLLYQTRDRLFSNAAPAWPRSRASCCYAMESHGSSSFAHSWNWSHQSHRCEKNSLSKGSKVSTLQQTINKETKNSNKNTNQQAANSKSDWLYWLRSKARHFTNHSETLDYGLEMNWPKSFKVFRTKQQASKTWNWETEFLFYFFSEISEWVEINWNCEEETTAYWCSWFVCTYQNEEEASWRFVNVPGCSNRDVVWKKWEYKEKKTETVLLCASAR